MVTNAASRIPPNFPASSFLKALIALFLIAWLGAAIAPEDRFDWFLENVLVVIGFGGLFYYYRTHPISDLSYALILAFLLLHLMGSHYTYSKVPVGFWFQEMFSQDRNHFDRLVHFSFGLLLAYPLREALSRYTGAGRGLSAFTSFTIVATASAVYETIEWAVAVIVSPDSAMAYLGTQGDVFDAQKDATLAMVGGLLGLMFKRSHFDRMVTSS